MEETIWIKVKEVVCDVLTVMGAIPLLFVENKTAESTKDGAGVEIVEN